MAPRGELIERLTLTHAGVGFVGMAAGVATNALIGSGWSLVAAGIGIIAVVVGGAIAADIIIRTPAK